MKKFFNPTNKIHKALIYAMNFIAAFTFLISLMALDSESWIPIITWVASGLWLTAYGWANEILYFGETEDEE